MSGLVCVVSGADANLGRRIPTWVGVVACGRWPFFGAEAVLVGLIFGVDVDGPVNDGDGVGSEFEFVWLGLGIPEVCKRRIVGVKPVIRKTSDNERFSVLVSVASGTLSSSGGVCSSTPSFIERLARCRSNSNAEGISGGTRTREGTWSGAFSVADGTGPLVFGIAPRGSFRS